MLNGTIKPMANPEIADFFALKTRRGIEAKMAVQANGKRKINRYARIIEIAIHRNLFICPVHLRLPAVHIVIPVVEPIRKLV